MLVDSHCHRPRAQGESLQRRKEKATFGGMVSRAYHMG